MSYEVCFGLGGGFGGCGEWEKCPCETLKDAEEYAYELAKEEYFSYSGMHGLFNREEALEEDPNLTEDDLEYLENEDMEQWVTYEAREIGG